MHGVKDDFLRLGSGKRIAAAIPGSVGVATTSLKVGIIGGQRASLLSTETKVGIRFRNVLVGPLDPLSQRFSGCN